MPTKAESAKAKAVSHDHIAAELVALRRDIPVLFDTKGYGGALLARAKSAEDRLANLYEPVISPHASDEEKAELRPAVYDRVVAVEEYLAAQERELNT